MLTKLRSGPFADLLLPAGAPLSISNGGDYFPDLRLYADDERLTEVGLTASGWDWPADPEYPDEPRWARELNISLWYADETGNSAAKQVLTIHSSHRGGDPSLSHNLYALAYAETGYEGHADTHLDSAPEQTRFLLELFEELFAHTPQGREIIARA